MTLRIGDLVEYQNERWYVAQRHAGVRTVILRQLDGKSQEIPNDSDSTDCKVIANLPRQWPFVAAPRHSKAGPITDITVVRQHKRFSLKPMQAWVPSDSLQNGGVIYFHPKLALRPGEVLVAHHQNGGITRLSITLAFGTAQRRIALDEFRRDPPAPQTRYDHLMSEEEEDA